MALKKITAIVREDVIEGLVDELRIHGVPGASVIQAKGYGEYINTYSQDILEACVKIEIYAKESVAEKVAALILQNAQTGVEGDGIVVISSVDVLYRVRDRKGFS